MRIALAFCTALAVVSASLATNLHDGFGSYITTCNDTHVTFLNFAAQSCSGPSSTFSDVLNVCGIEYISILNKNFSWNAVCNSTNLVFGNFMELNCTEPVLLRTYNLGGCYECPNAICKDSVVPPPVTFGAILSELPWIENQWHVDSGSIFTGSMNSGTVFKVSYNATGTCWNSQLCDASIQPWITGFHSVSGVAFDSRRRRGYALAVLDAPVQVNVLISFSIDSSELYSIEAVAAADLNLFGNLSLNGLARSESVDGLFYATNLGNFTPNQGSLVVIDSIANTMSVAASGLFAADGAFVHNGRLYISEVFLAAVHVYDISNSTSARNPVKIVTYQAPGLTSLDDFFVGEIDGITTIVGADWKAGQIASWVADGSSNATRLHAAGLVHPTSVRPELDSHGRWTTGYVTVTQGGGFPPAGRGANGGAVYRLRL